MKIKLTLFIIFFFFLALFINNVFAEVTIRGKVQYWNLEQGINATKDTNPENIEGGDYLDARRLLVEVEFDSPLTIDEQTYTDDSGNYEVTHRNPLTGNWLVNVEVRAETRLVVNDDINTLVKCYKEATDLWPYHGQTGNRSVEKDQTITFNIYIGGPKNNIEEWNGDEDGEGRDHLIAFFSCQVILDAFTWLKNRLSDVTDFSRDTHLFYPSDKTRFNAYLSPPWAAWIDIEEGYFYPDVIDRDLVLGNRKIVSQKWSGLRGSITHEYGHKIMHDVYDLWPEPLEIWQRTSAHAVTDCLYAELGWVEGWAEFFAAAVLDWPTINGEKSALLTNFFGRKRANNIEHVYYPYYQPWPVTGEQFPLIDFAEMGNFDWRENIPEDKHAINEGENAAVLWDIYDPKGWEYLPKEEQDAKPVEWPAALKWYDRLSDPQLTLIWEMIAGYREYGPIDVRRQPDCLIDEGDVFEDSFWYYWKNKDDGYGNDTELMHGLKAIMFNRGITSVEYVEHRPEVRITKVDMENNKIEIEVTEEDIEDRPYLYYNLAYCTGPINNTQTIIVFDKDQPLNGIWEENRLNFSIDIPSIQYRKLIVLVHDNMLSSFATFENDLFIQQGEEVLRENSYLYLEEISLLQHRYTKRFKVRGDYAYIFGGSFGMNIFDVSIPEEPRKVGEFKLPGFSTSYLDVEIIEVISQENDVTNKYALLAYGIEGLRVVNITEPENPIEISFLKEVIREETNVSLTLDPYAVSYDNQLAYVACGIRGLSIIELSDLNHIKEINYLNCWDERIYLDICDVLVAGNYAYLADRRFGLRIIDITNVRENQIQRMGSLSFGGEGYPKKITQIFEVEDEKQKSIYLFVIDSLEGLSMIDVTDSENPRQVYHLPVKDNIYSVHVSGSYAFVGGSKGLLVLDISNPSQPEEVRFYNMDESPVRSKWQMYAINSIEIAQNLVYFLYDGSLNIVSMHHLAGKPDFVLDFRIDEKEEKIKQVKEVIISEEVSIKLDFTPMGISIKGDSVYIAEHGQLIRSQWTGGGLRIWDISTRTQPKNIGFCDTPSVDPTSVTIEGNFAFVGHNHKCVQVVDVSNPSSPFNLGRCDAYLWEIQQIIVRDEWILAVGKDGFQMIHMMNPSHLFAADYISNSYSKQAVLAGNLLYLITGGCIKIYNIANPANPFEIGTYNLKGLAEGLTAEGFGTYHLKIFSVEGFARKNNILYLACGNDGLKIIDITDPVHPKMISSIALEHYARKIILHRDYAYIWHGDSLTIVDVHDPDLPAKAGFFQHPRGKSINSLAITEDSKYLYLIDFDKHMNVLGINEKTY